MNATKKLSANGAARRLGVTVSTIIRAIDDGRLAAETSFLPGNMRSFAINPADLKRLVPAEIGRPKNKSRKVLAFAKVRR